MNMTRNSRNNRRDAQVQQVLDVLAEHKRFHPDCRIEVRRQNLVSIRIRIVDPDFEGKNRVDREPEVWTILKTLPEDVFANITNAFNHTNLGDPSGVMPSPNFGKSTSAQDARQIQAGVRFQF